MYNEKYINEIKSFVSTLDLDFLENQTICITGGTGLIGSYLVDSILFSNKNIKLILLCSNKARAEKRFEKFVDDSRLMIVEQNLMLPIEINEPINYIISAASFSDSKNYGLYPVETLNINVIGNYNLFELARKQTDFKKYFFSSSSEIYGEETDILKETTKGIVNCLDIRSCYNESKRLCETMCVAYSHEYNIPTVVGRFSRIYGPSMKLEDSKALSQFLTKGVNKEDVVLKSKGEQQFSYCYVSDSVSAVFKLLKDGKNAEAYNITNNNELLSLKEIAQIVADTSGVELKFEIPTSQESIGYSRATIAVQDASKLRELGWNATINLKEGIKNTYEILKERKR